MPRLRIHTIVCLRIVVTLSLVALVHLAVEAQDGPANRSTLTPTDYIEIQQLVARYGFAVDSSDTTRALRAPESQPAQALPFCA